MPEVPPPGATSRYLAYLPAVLRENRDPFGEGTGLDLGRFLLAFEAVLSGEGDPERPGLEERVGGIRDPAGGEPPLAGLHRYAEPGPGLPPGRRAPAEFLDWLSGWVALTLRADLGEETRRQLIARAVPLYRKRGTKEGLLELLGVYLERGGVAIDELAPLRLGVAGTTVGVDTVVDGGAPHFFRVTLKLPDAGGPAELRRYDELARAVIDAERPAHCRYELHLETAPLQLGVRSTVGLDTLLPFG